MGYPYAYGQPIRVRVAHTHMGCPYAYETAHTRMGRIPVWDGTPILAAHRGVRHGLESRTLFLRFWNLESCIGR